MHGKLLQEECVASGRRIHRKICSGGCTAEALQAERGFVSTFFVVEAKVLTHFSGGADGADIPLHYEGLGSCCYCDLHTLPTCHIIAYHDAFSVS